MTLSDWGAIGDIITGIVAVVGLLYGAACFINKVNMMYRNLQGLMVARTPDLIERYENTITSEEKTDLPDKMKALLDKSPILPYFVSKLPVSVALTATVLLVTGSVTNIGLFLYWLHRSGGMAIVGLFSSNF